LTTASVTQKIIDHLSIKGEKCRYSASIAYYATDAGYLYLLLCFTSLSYFYDLDTDPLLIGASAYFNLDPHLVTSESTGIYHYVSTRNNDFSNRDQKGRIIVQPFPFKYQLIGQNSYTMKLE